jgi:hypothetical protein
LPAWPRPLFPSREQDAFQPRRFWITPYFAAFAGKRIEGSNMPEGLVKLIIFGAFGFFVCAAFTGWVYG